MDRLPHGTPARLACACACAGFGLGFAPEAHAEVVAHFRAQSIAGGCLVDPHESAPEGDPDRFFRLAIFDAGTAPLAGCPVGCNADATPATADGQSSDFCTINTGCGVWNFADQETTKVIANQSGANFYFGLFDADDPPFLSPADLLGDHWLFASAPSSGSFANNNQSPYNPSAPTTPVAAACGRAVDGAGNGGNYSVTYSIFFEDTTPPTAPASLSAVDDTISGVAWDNDARLDLQWTAATDVNSGISAQTLSLFDQTAGSDVFLNEAILTSTSGVSLCASGCSLAMTPIHNHTYLANLSATNGLLPQIVNAVSATSTQITIRVDLQSPSSAIASPAAGAWLGAGVHSIGTNDSDSGSGLAACAVRVASGGSQTVAPHARSCDASTAISVGAAQDCRHEGNLTCQVTIDSTDAARRTSGLVSRFFSVDFTADPIGALVARTEPGGELIPPGVPQSDATPTFEWEAPASASPIVGYSHALGGVPDCTVETAAKSVGVGPLPAGSTLFRVRAIDQAGNCGTAASFDLQVLEPAPVPALGWPGRAILALALLWLGRRTLARLSAP